MDADLIYHKHEVCSSSQCYAMPMTELPVEITTLPVAEETLGRIIDILRKRSALGINDNNILKWISRLLPQACLEIDTFVIQMNDELEVHCSIPLEWVLRAKKTLNIIKYVYFSMLKCHEHNHKYLTEEYADINWRRLAKELDLCNQNLLSLTQKRIDALHEWRSSQTSSLGCN
jgi:hypothetical protein